MRICEENDCQNKAIARGLCKKHYARLQRTDAFVPRYKLIAPNKTHGLSTSAEYICWSNIRARCRNPKSKNYPHYGGKGITVCDEWYDSFERFIEDMGERPSEKHSLDRINPLYSYHKDNCRWALWNTQTMNKIYNMVFEYNGLKMTAKEWLTFLDFETKRRHNDKA